MENPHLILYEYYLANYIPAGAGVMCSCNRTELSVAVALTFLLTIILNTSIILVIIYCIIYHHHNGAKKE